MMNTFTIFLFFFVFFFDLSRSAETDEEALFQSWKTQHNKVYESKEEESKRLKNFRENLEDINMRNHHNEVHHGGKGASFGLNHFSDLSFEEFSQQFLAPIPEHPVSNQKHTFKSKLGAVPQTMDWRSTFQTPIKNQGQCGSCWALASSELAESAFLWNKKPIVPLSPQQLVDCSTLDGQGCSGQSISRSVKYLQTEGLVSEKAYPYKAVSSKCKIDIVNSSVRSRVTQVGSMSLRSYPNQEQGLLELAVSRGPVIFLVAVDKPFQSYRKGIMLAEQCNISPFIPGKTLNHMLQVTGWNITKTDNTTKPYWIFRNSWASNWGEQGQIRLSFGENTCYISQGSAYWATV